MRPALEFALSDGLRHRDALLAIWLFGPDDRPLCRLAVAHQPAGLSLYATATATVGAAFTATPHLPIAGIVLMARGLVGDTLAWVGAFADTDEDIQVTVPGSPDALDPYGPSERTTTGTVARMLLQAAGYARAAQLAEQRMAAAPFN